MILQEAQRTRVIVQNLLSFARQMPAQREPVHLNSVLQQTLKLRSYDFSNHGVEITEDYDADLPLVIGDPHQLQQVFLNILNNAYDAVQEMRARRTESEFDGVHRDGMIEIAFGTMVPASRIPNESSIPFSPPRKSARAPGWG